VAIDLQAQRVMIGHRIGNNWVIDASVSKTLAVNTDYKLGVTIKGSSVSVTFNDQAAVGFVFNAIATDGRFGVFAKGAGTAAATISLDNMTVKTSDPAVQAALAASPGQTTSSLGSTSTQTASLIDWSAQGPVAEKDKIASLATSDPLEWYVELEPVEV